VPKRFGTTFRLPQLPLQAFHDTGAPVRRPQSADVRRHFNLPSPEGELSFWKNAFPERLGTRLFRHSAPQGRATRFAFKTFSIAFVSDLGLLEVGSIRLHMSLCVKVAGRYRGDELS
jgi:hypothetical protein